MAQVTINEGLAWLKTLKKRHEELIALRNDNAHSGGWRGELSCECRDLAAVIRRH